MRFSKIISLICLAQAGCATVKAINSGYPYAIDSVEADESNISFVFFNYSEKTISEIHCMVYFEESEVIAVYKAPEAFLLGPRSHEEITIEFDETAQAKSFYPNRIVYADGCVWDDFYGMARLYIP